MGYLIRSGNVAGASILELFCCLSIFLASLGHEQGLATSLLDVGGEWHREWQYSLVYSTVRWS